MPCACSAKKKSVHELGEKKEKEIICLSQVSLSRFIINSNSSGKSYFLFCRNHRHGQEYDTGQGGHSPLPVTAHLSGQTLVRGMSSSSWSPLLQTDVKKAPRTIDSFQCPLTMEVMKTKKVVYYETIKRDLFLNVGEMKD
jgi:hypothetical protein